MDYHGKNLIFRRNFTFGLPVGIFIDTHIIFVGDDEIVIFITIAAIVGVVSALVRGLAW
jgi:hypothetical protein